MQEAIFANARLVISSQQEFHNKPAIDLSRFSDLPLGLTYRLNTQKTLKSIYIIGEKFGEYTKDLLQLKVVL